MFHATTQWQETRHWENNVQASDHSSTAVKNIAIFDTTPYCPPLGLKARTPSRDEFTVQTSRVSASQIYEDIISRCVTNSTAIPPLGN